MKTNLTKAGTWTLSGITQKQYDAIREVLDTANDRCFQKQESDGRYFSGDDFVCTLDEDEREALREVCKSL